jgi:hypothetical protein
VGAKEQTNMTNKINFITNAISDTQSTIRAIDTKLGAVIAGSLLPFSVLGRIWSHIGEISKTISPYLGCALGFLFFFIWIISILLLIKTLSAIDNPREHIESDSTIKGVFYSGGMFKLGVKDYYFFNSSVKSADTVQEQVSNYPNDEADVVKELAFEHLKLIYIRDVKLHRLKGALILCSVWFFLGVVILGFSKLV